MTWTDGLATETLAARTAVVNAFTGIWPGYTGQTINGSDLVATSSADLATKVAALDTTDLSKWHRILLDSTAPSINWSANSIRGSTFDALIHVVGHYYGGNRDRSSAGGGIYIAATNPAVPVVFSGTFTIRGVRGVHFGPGIIFGGTAVATPDNAGRDGASCVAITTSSTDREGPVLRFEGVKFGSGYLGETDPRYYATGINMTGACEQLDIVDCTFLGLQTGMKGVGARYLRTFGNDLQQINGDGFIPLHSRSVTDINSAFDERQIWWSRLNTIRNMSDIADLSAEHTDYMQCGTSGDIGGYSVLHEFDAGYLERITGTDGVTITFSAQPTVGSSITVKGTTFVFVTSDPVGLQIRIGATLIDTLDNAATKIAAVGITGLNRTDRSSTFQLRLDYNYGQWAVPTVSGSPAANATVGGGIRYTGGTQAFYNDDIPIGYNIDCTIIHCIVAVNDGIASRAYNGTSRFDRVTMVRPGAMGPDAVSGTDGFNYSNDYDAYATSSRKTSAVTVDHTFRSSVMAYALDVPAGTVNRVADGVFTTANSSLTLANNRYVKFKKTALTAEQPAAMLAGTFGTDAQGRVSYSFADDGVETQQAFRARLYNQTKLANTTDRANIGATDPADWPGAPVIPAGEMTLSGGAMTISAPWLLASKKTLLFAGTNIFGGTWQVATTTGPTSFTGARRYKCTAIRRILKLKVST